MRKLTHRRSSKRQPQLALRSLKIKTKLRNKSQQPNRLNKRHPQLRHSLHNLLKQWHQPKLKLLPQMLSQQTLNSQNRRFHKPLRSQRRPQNKLRLKRKSFSRRDRRC